MNIFLPLEFKNFLTVIFDQKFFSCILKGFVFIILKTDFSCIVHARKTEIGGLKIRIFHGRQKWLILNRVIMWHVIQPCDISYCHNSSIKKFVSLKMWHVLCVTSDKLIPSDTTIWHTTNCQLRKFEFLITRNSKKKT